MASTPANEQANGQQDESDAGLDHAIDDLRAGTDRRRGDAAAEGDKPAAALPGKDFGADAKPSVAKAARKASEQAGNLDLIMDIPIDMQVVLGTSRLPVSSLMNLGEGSLIGLDRKIGEPVDIMVNGRLFGRGEITLLESEESRFGVKLLEVMGEGGK